MTKAILQNHNQSNEGEEVCCQRERSQVFQLANQGIRNEDKKEESLVSLDWPAKVWVMSVYNLEKEDSESEIQSLEFEALWSANLTLTNFTFSAINKM